MRKVLVIESATASRECLKRFLIRQNIDAFTASDGCQGLHKAKVNNPELIISSYSLDDLTGGDLLKRIRREGIRIPVIFRYDPDEVKALPEEKDYSYVKFLREPVKPAELLENMAELLEVSKYDVYQTDFFPDDDGRGEDSVTLVSKGVKIDVKLTDIIVISSEGGMSEIFLAEGHSFMARKSFESWDMLLPCSDFIRLDENFIINASHVDNVWKLPGEGKIDIRMKGYNFYINAEEIYDERLLEKVK